MRVKEKHQHHQAILVEMQLAVPRLVALTTVVMQPFEQRQQLVEVLQPDAVLLGQPPVSRGRLRKRKLS